MAGLAAPKLRAFWPKPSTSKLGSIPDIGRTGRTRQGAMFLFDGSACWVLVLTGRKLELR